MDGAITIIDGEPGKGKTLEALRRMLDSARRGRNITTNIKILPAGIAAMQKLNPQIIILQLRRTEVSEFWKYTPEETDVYIDEAHLQWASIKWSGTRTEEFMSYSSQFRKYGDSIYLLCQDFTNLDKFLRQRATHLIRCKCLRIPKWSPIAKERPLLFITRHHKVQRGEDEGPTGWPNVITPDNCTHLYTYYETRQRLDEGEYAPRPTWEEILRPKSTTEQTPSTNTAPEPTKEITTMPDVVAAPPNAAETSQPT